VSAKPSRPLGIRGIMLDPARLTERHEFYFDTLGKLAEWGYNTLWWHFVDDEGFVLKLDSHPELATPYAFSKAETRRFVKAAKQVGIEVVPEVECLGHARYLTRLPQYAHLADGDAHAFNAVCPSHRDTVPLLTEIIEEVADLFDGEYFHAGLDEVNLSGCKRCRRRMAGRPAWRIFTDHTKKLHEVITGCGKRMIMWADHVEKAPAMLKALPKDIVLCHWHYGEVNANKVFERSLAAGFEIVGGCSMLRHRDVIQPKSRQLRNTEQMVATGRRLAGKGMLGAVTTWWTARRILRDTGLPIAAYTGHLLSGGVANRAAFFQRYVQKEFGVRSKAAGNALAALHDKTLNLTELLAVSMDSPADLVSAVAMAGQKDFAERAADVRRANDAISTVARKAKRNLDQAKALVLSGQVAEGLLTNALDLVEAHKFYSRAEFLKDRGYERSEVAQPLEEVAGILGKMVSRLSGLCKEVSSEWDRTRHPGDAKKATRDLSVPCPVDSLLGRQARSRKYLESLRRGLERGTKAYLKGGPFPTGL